MGHYYTVTQPTNVTGVLALLPATNIPESGTGSLAWNASTGQLSWRGGPGVTVNRSVDASYDLPEPAPYGSLDLIAVVTAGALPAASASDTLSVAEASATAGLGNEQVAEIHNAVEFDGDIYIGLYNHQLGYGYIYRTADGVNRVSAAASPFQPGSLHHVDSFVVFNGELYAGTDNGQIWRTADGTLWTQASPSLPLGQNITDLTVYDGVLYANQAGNGGGGGIFSSTNGSTWTQDYTFPGQDVYTEFFQPFASSLFSAGGTYGGFFGGSPGAAIVSSPNGTTWVANRGRRIWRREQHRHLGTGRLQWRPLRGNLQPG